jgi:hypothetical protein
VTSLSAPWPRAVQPPSSARSPVLTLVVDRDAGVVGTEAIWRPSPGRKGRLADHLCCIDMVVLDELGYLPFAQDGGQLLFRLVSRLYEKTWSSSPATSPSANGPQSSAPRR